MRGNQRQLYVELQHMTEQGIMLFLDGNPSSPAGVTQAVCAKEESCYMRDYVYDEEKGVLKELRFDKVTER